jgi:hypothetical protein
MNANAVTKYVEKLEKIIDSLIKAPAVLFPSTNEFRIFKRSLSLRLTALGCDYMVLHPKAAIITILKNSIDAANAPTDAQTVEINNIFVKLDAAVTNLLLLSIPPKLYAENDGYMAFTEGAARDPLHGTSFAILNRISTQLSHKVEAEKCEFLGILGSMKNPQEEMSAYIGKKLTAKQLLAEKFADPISDAMCRTYLIAGLVGDPASKSLSDRLLQEQNQSLHETISFMEVFSREQEKSTALHQQHQQQALSMFDSVATQRNFTTHPPQKGTPPKHNKEKQGRPKNSSSSSSSSSAKFCFNNALKLPCNSTPCPFPHLPAHTVSNTMCPFSQCRKAKSGQCPFSHSHSSPASLAVEGNINPDF